MSQLKLSSFYGDRLARPYVLLDKEGNALKGRVEAPAVNDALIEWASKVPVGRGGTLVKPEWDGPEAAPKQARTDFQIFFQERFDDVLAASPAMFGGASDRKAMLAAASIYWRENLSPEERAAYHARALAEKQAQAEQIAEAEQADPKFKTFREKLQKYKTSVTNILSAAKVSAGPLWRQQRRLNAKYRQLEEQQAQQEEEQDAAQEDEQAAGGSSKAAGKGQKAAAKGKGKGKRGAASKKRLVESEDSSSSEDEEGVDVEGAEAEQEAHAVAAMQKLLLATAKKSGKAGAGAAAKGRKAAAVAVPSKKEQQQEEAIRSSSDDEEADSPQQQQQTAGRGSRGTRSGAATLAERLATGGKGRKGMYADAFELPPSQSATPAGKTRGATAAASSKASPAKRTRATRHSAVAVAAPAAAEESPAKKPRRTGRK